jgi:hypothetical protein
MRAFDGVPDSSWFSSRSIVDLLERNAPMPSGMPDIW